MDMMLFAFTEVSMLSMRGMQDRAVRTQLRLEPSSNLRDAVSLHPPLGDPPRSSAAFLVRQFSAPAASLLPRSAVSALAALAAFRVRQFLPLQPFGLAIVRHRLPNSFAAPSLRASQKPARHGCRGQRRRFGRAACND